MTRRKTRADVIELIVGHGGTYPLASDIADALDAAGLSPAESRWWLSHPSRAYPVPTGTLRVGDVDHPRRQTPIFALEDRRGHLVLGAARQLAAASEDERFISWWLGGNLDDVRRLTGGDKARTIAIRAIAERLRNDLRKPERVNEAIQTLLPGRGEKRIADLILDGREAEVLADLASGRIDPRELLETGELHFHGW